MSVYYPGGLKMPASYERRILPALHSICGRDPPAHELTGELFELLLQKLTDERNYSDGTAGHYRHLIPLAYQAGVEHDHFPDALFWEDLFDAETATDREKEARARETAMLNLLFSAAIRSFLPRRFAEYMPIRAGLLRSVLPFCLIGQKYSMESVVVGGVEGGAACAGIRIGSRRLAEHLLEGRDEGLDVGEAVAKRTVRRRGVPREKLLGGMAYTHIIQVGMKVDSQQALEHTRKIAGGILEHLRHVVQRQVLPIVLLNIIRNAGGEKLIALQRRVPGGFSCAVQREKLQQLKQQAHHPKAVFRQRLIQFVELPGDRFHLIRYRRLLRIIEAEVSANPLLHKGKGQQDAHADKHIAGSGEGAGMQLAAICNEPVSLAAVEVVASDVELDLSAQRDSDLQTAMPMQRRVNSCAL